MSDTAKTINLTYEGKTYTLEFSRAVVRAMERQGFSLDNLGTMPANTIPELFAGAFRMHHSTVKREKIERIFDSLTHRNKLVEKLSEMYLETVATLFDEPDDDDEGNANWEPSW